MKVAGFRMGQILGVSLCSALFLMLVQFSPCEASDQPGKRSFLRNLSKIRQPGQNLHFIVYDTATYFGLSDAEKVDLLEFLRTVWEEPVTETHGLTIKEHGELKYFLSNAFKDTLRNYGWTDDEKNAFSNFKRLYYDTHRMDTDTAAGREIRERWLQRREDLQRAEQEKGTRGELRARADIVRDSIEVEQKKEKQKHAIEAQAKWEEAGRNLPVPVQSQVRTHTNMGDPAFYHGLSKEEVTKLFEITKPIFADPYPETQPLKLAVHRFLLNGFADTLRSYGWTNEEKSRLEEFRKEAEKLGLYQYTEEERIGRLRRYKDSLRNESKK